MQTLFRRITRPAILGIAGIAATLGSPAWAVPINKGTVEATLCNTSTKPVEFRFYNHGDDIKAKFLFKRSVRACSCVEQETKTNSRRLLPKTDILQQVYRDVQSTSGESIKVCVSAKGTFEGYIDAKATTCVEAKKTRNYLPAPELTYAQGDVKKIATDMHPDAYHCVKNKPNGKCADFAASYTYTDGVVCRGNGRWPSIPAN